MAGPTQVICVVGQLVKLNDSILLNNKKRRKIQCTVPTSRKLLHPKIAVLHCWHTFIISTDPIA
jgi:hypothetical protein